MSPDGRAPEAGFLQRRLWSRPYLLLAFTMLSWGGNAVASRMAVGEVSPLALTCLRWLVVLAALALLGRRTFLPGWRAVLPYWRRALLMGALGLTAFNAVFYEAGALTTAVNIGVIQGVMPLFVLVGAALAYRTPITTLQIVGIAVAGIGPLVVASTGDASVLLSLSFNRGDIAMLLGSTLYAGYAVALRRAPPVPPLTFFSAIAVAAFLTSIPLLGLEVLTGRVLWPSRKGWLILLFVGLVPSLFAQLTFMRAVELIGPARAGLFINLLPVFAAALGVLILGESFRPYHAAALAFVLGGIYLAERGRPSA